MLNAAARQIAVSAAVIRVPWGPGLESARAACHRVADGWRADAAPPSDKPNRQTSRRRTTGVAALGPGDEIRVDLRRDSNGRAHLD